MALKKIKITYDTGLKEKARELRNQLTPAEKIFRNAWRKMPLSKTLRFNRQKPLGAYIVDFYCHPLGLVIEIDGDSHHGPDAEGYDRTRTAYLEGLGLKVVRFTNHEVMNEIEGVMVVLSGIVGERSEKSP